MHRTKHQCLLGAILNSELIIIIEDIVLSTNVCIEPKLLFTKPDVWSRHCVSHGDFGKFNGIDIYSVI